MRTNTVIDNHRAGRVSVGAFVNFNDPLSAQIVANAGFDWVLVDMEHGPVPLSALGPAVTAIRTTAAEPFVRAPWNTSAAIQTALDCGPSGIMVPMVSTAELARAVVRDCYYPPRGERSRGGMRGPLSFQAESTTYFAQADDAIFVMAQIETVQAIENLEDIAAVEGIDCLFVGPADLGASYGFDYPAKWAPDMSGPYADAIARVVEVARRFKKSAGFQAASTAIANDCIARGFDVVGMSSDVGMLAATARRERAALQTGR
jgi:4-hydroxy-2-oxoheptanedioate aldolase